MVSRDDEGKEVPVEKVEVAKKPYQFLWVSILREYLAFEFKPDAPLSFPWDQERVYDDFGGATAVIECMTISELPLSALQHEHAAVSLVAQASWG